MSAHVPTYMLLELATGELGPERNILPFVLGHLDECSECAAALDVLIALRANRAEALEAVRGAEAPTGPSVWGWLTGWLVRLVRG